MTENNHQAPKNQRETIKDKLSEVIIWYKTYKTWLHWTTLGLGAAQPDSLDLH